MGKGYPMFERNGRLLLKRFSNYFFPTILMSMALSMSIVVDGIIVGNMLSPEAFAAVNLGLPLMQGFAAVFVFFGIGGSVLAAWYMGRHEASAANTVFTVSVLGLLAAGAICGVLGAVFLDKLTSLLSGGNPALRDLLYRFIQPLVYGAPFLIVVPGLTYFVRTDGRPGLASAILITANLVNLACDVLFIHLLDDVRGAGLATVTGYAAGVGLLLAYAVSPHRTFRFALSRGALLPLVLQTLKSGLPSGLNIGLQFLKLLCLNALVLSVAGKSGMVAFSVCLACLSLASMFISGASQTMMPIIGVLCGEEDYAGIRFVFRRALTILMGSTAILVCGLLLFPQQLLALFGISGGQDMEMGTRAVRLFAPSLFGDAFAMLMIYYAQTIQRPKVAITATVIQSFAVVAPCAWLLSRWWGLDGIWLSFSVAGLATALALLLMTRGIAARSGGRVRGLLMMPQNGRKAALLDVSIKNTLHEAVGLSAAVAAFCGEHGVHEITAMRAGVIVEEMAVNTVRYSGNPPGTSSLDITVSVSQDSIRITFRDEGKPFSPLDYQIPPQAQTQQHTGHIQGGISLIRAMAAHMEYSYALGFNTSVIVLPDARN